MEEEMSIASYIDHTNLKADATGEDIKRICEEAKAYSFASVCVNSSRVKEAKELLKGTDVKVCSVIGFPLGAMATSAKAYEAKAAIDDGADEIDMVINIGFLKDRYLKGVEDDIRKVKEACGSKTLKVIIEACLLSDEEKEEACKAAMAANADYVKTSTGFSTGGATVHDVALMSKVVGDKLGVRAAGGIRDYGTAKAMVEAGATRLGCSAGVRIVEGEGRR